MPRDQGGYGRHEETVLTIRAFRQQDRAALYEVCLRTGDSGADASGKYQDPDLLGEVYVGPYLDFAPELALVAEDAAGVGGYVLGVPDTGTFEAWCEESWWPALRRRYPLSAFPASTPDGRLAAVIHDPPAAPADVVADYPAHLHVDLLPRFQGRGYGRGMMTAMFAALADKDSGGVHLGVSSTNTRAIGFYRHLGMAVHTETGDALIMTRRLRSRGGGQDAAT